MKGGPSLKETSEYYYTKILNFDNLHFGLKFALQTVSSIFSPLLIKYNLINQKSKLTLLFFYLLVMSASIISGFIFT